MPAALRVAVITPHHSARPEWLEQCIASVRAQTYPCDHVVVCDGVKLPPRGDLRIVELPRAHDDYGNTPRVLGSISAFRQGYDAVAWLDDDNWFAPEHVETMVEAMRREGAPVAASTRTIVTREGRTMGLCTETDPARFVDSSCYLLHVNGRALLNAWWMMDEDLHPYGDKVFFRFLKQQGVSPCFTGRPTVFYRTCYAVHYRRYGFPVPEGAPEGMDAVYFKKHGRLPRWD